MPAVELHQYQEYEKQESLITNYSEGKHMVTKLIELTVFGSQEKRLINPKYITGMREGHYDGYGMCLGGTTIWMVGVEGGWTVAESLEVVAQKLREET